MPNIINKRKQRPHKYIYRECTYCKKLYKVYPSGLDRSKYCSRVCKDNDMLGKVLNKTNKCGRPKGNNFIILTCPVCQANFNCYKSQIKMYCSRKCYSKYRHSNKVIKKHNNKVITKLVHNKTKRMPKYLEKSIKICNTCSKPFEYVPHKNRDRKYCSVICFKIGQRGRIPWNKNKKGLQKHTEEFKDKQRNNRLRYMSTHVGPFRDTSIELIIKNAFIDNCIPFKQSVRIGKYCADFIVKDKVIECDGYYWHNRPGDKLKDFVRDCYIINEGYKVLRFSDYNIENNINDCINIIKTTK